MSYNPCDTSIVIHTDIHLPELDLAKSLMVDRYQSIFDVDPHITHLLLPMFEQQYQKLQPVLNRYILNLSPIEVQIGEVVLEEDSGFFYLPVSSLYLNKLHEELLNLCMPYRNDAVREKDISRMANSEYSEKEFDFIIKYGYPRVLELHKPQISLGRCETKSGDFNIIEDELNVVLDNIINTQITLSEMTIILIGKGQKQSEMAILYEEKIDLNSMKD